MKVYIHDISNAGTKFTEYFNIPYQHKKVKGFFIYGDSSNTKIGLKIASKEIIPNGFDAKLIEFNGYLPIADITFPCDEAGLDAPVELNIDRAVANSLRLYFIVE